MTTPESWVQTNKGTYSQQKMMVQLCYASKVPLSIDINLLEQRLEVQSTNNVPIDRSSNVNQRKMVPLKHSAIREPFRAGISAHAKHDALTPSNCAIVHRPAPQSNNPFPENYPYA